MTISLETKTARVGLLITLWFILFSPVISSLWVEWIVHSKNSQGLLVPFVSLYIIWSKRHQLRDTALSVSSWGALILIGSLFIYIISFTGDVAFFSRVMMVFSLTGLIHFNFGKDVTKTLIFPLFFLFFMIPVPESLIERISIPLQLFASTVSNNLIKLFSIPVFREGNMLYFAKAQLEVAQACSGLRSIESLAMLSVLFVYFLPKGNVRKIILLGSAIPIALLANIVRVTGTGILAHFYGSVVAMGFLHKFSGLVVFGFGFTALLLEFALLTKIGGRNYSTE